MNVRRNIFAVLVAGVLLAFAAPAVNAQPPTPEGDSYLVPATVKLNASKTITGTEGATMQSDSIEETTCDADDNATRSVWFGFTLPDAAMIDISGAGSWYATDDEFSEDVVMTVYEADGPSLDHIVCDGVGLLAIEAITIPAGTYRVRVAYDGADPVTGASQARVSVRLRQLGNFMDDAQFEESLGVQWKAKKAGTPPQITHSCPSDCTIRFNGAAGGSIKNSVKLPTDILKIKPGDYINALISVNSTPAGGSNLKVKLQISYTDGTPTTTVSAVRHATLVTTGSGVSVTAGYINAIIQSKAVDKITLTITSPEATDLFNVWGVAVGLFAGGNVRDAKPLPAPLSSE